jgi:catecholate siderophore receptor
MKKYPVELLNNAPSRLLMALATTVAAAHPASAADAPTAPKAAQSAPAAEPSLAPVVVKGQRENGKPETGYKTETTKIGKLDQAPKDIPQSITIVTSKLIEDRRQDSLKAALANVSGLTFNAGEGGRIGDNINLRGYVAYGDLYQDGMRDIAQYNREVFNLDSVEVLRGAASMLFGRGSTGGVINQTSKVPYLADENTVSATIGNHDYLRTTADLNKVIGETTAIRLNTMTTKSAGDPEGADTKRYGFAPTLRTGIGTDNEFQIGYYHLNYDDTPYYGYAWASGRPVDSTAGKFYGTDNNFQRDSADVVTASYTHRFDNKTKVTSTLRYGDYKRDLWATAPRLSGSAAVTDQTSVTRQNQRRGGEEKHLFSQTDLTSRFEFLGMKHEALAGIELARENSERWSYANTPQQGNATTGDPSATASQGLARNGMRTSFNYFTSSTYGLYTQDIIEFLPKWKLLAGARWDRFTGYYDAVPTGQTTYQRMGRKDYLWSYRGGLIRELTDSVNVYASYGTSFNTSGDLYQYDSNTSKTPPEESRNIEFGSKAEFLDGDLSVRGALFRTQKFNERSTDIDTASGAYLLSGARHTDGWEIEITGKITDKWETFFNFAHMWSNIDKAGSTGSATVGRPAANTPTNSASWWNTYRILQDWTIGAGADGVSKRNPSHNSSNWAPGYVKYDAMLRYDQDKYTVSLNVNNIFNKVYWLSVYNGHIAAGPLRTVQLTTEYRF